MAACLYAYLGFPLLLTVVGLLRRAGPVRKGPVTPRVSLVIAAYNEGATIARRVENALWADYPRELLEIIVASDGSTDDTESIALRYAGVGVRVLALPRMGKARALDEAVRRATGDVLVFSDANTLLEPGALRALTANFADPTVGGVVGHTGYKLPEEGESSGRGEAFYWRYDTWLKQMESHTGSVVSAHGGLHAVRAELYRTPETGITDDFAISTAVVVQGYRLVFEPRARGWEEATTRAQGEFRRRVRLVTRGLRGVLVRRALLNPVRYGFYAVAFFSHKVLRRLLRLALLGLFVGSALLSSQGGIHGVAAAGQGAFYGLAAVGYLGRRTRVGRSKLLYVPFYFVLTNAAALVGLWSFVRGRKIALWEPQRDKVAAVPEVAATEASDGATAANAAATAPASNGRSRHPGARSGAAAPAVVIGLDSATGLQTARILAARSVPVLGVARDLRHPCCRTRACDRTLTADTTGPELVDTLVCLGPELAQRAVLFPCTDASVLVLSRNRDALAPWYHLVLPEPEVVELLMDKGSFYAFAEERGFAVPVTRVLRSPDDAAWAAEDLPFPCVIKPAFKTEGWRRRATAKAYRVDTARELLALFDRFWPEAGPLVAQEWIAGGDTDHYTCNAYFGAQSEPLVTFTTRKLRQWPPMGGEACLSEESRNEVIRDETVRFFREVRHRGLGYLEMKQDVRTGQHVILEPNVGRPTGRSAQAEASGVELLFTQYCDALGRELPPSREQAFRGVKWIYLRRDLQSALHRWRRGELTPSEWAHSWRGPMQDALFSAKAPGPLLADFAYAVREARRRALGSRIPAAFAAPGHEAVAR